MYSELDSSAAAQRRSFATLADC